MYGMQNSDIIYVQNKNFTTLLRENYLNMMPYFYIVRVTILPIKGKYENRNRKCKNCYRDRNQKRWQNLRFEKICRLQNKSGCIGKQIKINRLKFDQWGACRTPIGLEQ